MSATMWRGLYASSKLRASSSTFLASDSTGAQIAAINDPFGSGSSYATLGTVPGQLAMSGNAISKGATEAVLGTDYSVKVRATSADGKREAAETFVFKAIFPTDSISPFTRLITQALYYNNAEWTRGSKHRWASMPFINPVTFGKAADPLRPGDGLYPLQVAQANPTFDDRYHVFFNPSSFAGGATGGIYTVNGGGRILARNLDLSGGRFSLNSAVDQAMVEGCLADNLGKPGFDVIYLGSRDDNRGIACIQGCRSLNINGTNLTFHVTSDPNSAENVSTLTDTRMIGAVGATTNGAAYAVNATVITLASAGSGEIPAGASIKFSGDTNAYAVASGDADVSNGGTITLAGTGLKVAMSATAKTITLQNEIVKFTVSAPPPGGMPIATVPVKIAYTKLAGVDRKNQDFNQEWITLSTTGNVIYCLKNVQSGGDFPGTTAVADVSLPAKLWVMGGSNDGTLPGEHADGLGQKKGYNSFEEWRCHNNYGTGNYQVGGIVGGAKQFFSNIYVKFVRGIAEPSERSSLAVKVGALTQAITKPITISEYYIDGSDRPYVTSVSVSPGANEADNSFTPVGGQTMVDGNGNTLRSYNPLGPIRGGFWFNKAPPRDFAPLSTVGPTGVHPGVGDWVPPVSSQVSGISLSNYDTNSGVAGGDEIAQLDVVNTLMGNVILDVYPTGTTANYIAMKANIMKRGRLPLPVGTMELAFNVDVYPIDGTTHERGALAFRKALTANINVASTGAATTITSATVAAGLVTSTAGSSFTFTLAAIADATVGAANTTREALVPVVAYSSAARTITTVYVDGVAATLVPGSSAINSVGATNYTITGLYRVTLGAANGATGDVVVTMSGSSTACGIGVEVVAGIGVVYDVATFTGATFTQPSTATVFYGAGCLVVATAGYSTAATSGSRRKTHGKAMMTGTGQLAVTPTYTGADLNFGSGIVEAAGADLTTVAGGSPSTAGSVVVFGPRT